MPGVFLKLLPVVKCFVHSGLSLFRRAQCMFLCHSGLQHLVLYSTGCMGGARGGGLIEVQYFGLFDVQKWISQKWAGPA